LYVVATPIGNLDDITLRAVQTLGAVDRILAEDTRHTRRLLDHLQVAKPMQAVHEHNETGLVESVLNALRGGQSLALVSDAGTPLISDPGFPLVRACRAEGIEVVAVPGVSAVITALSVAGLPTDRFRFEGFLPRKRQARVDRLTELRSEVVTLVCYESSHRISETLEDCVAVFGPARRAVLARELTKRHEIVKSAPLEELAAWVAGDPNQQRGEIVLLLAGAPGAGRPDDTERLLRVLLAELPVRQASAIAARFTGRPKNEVYRRALALRND
jgi:16S rRNA (cytidine1402-2'-O)-methyltransferase